MEQHRSDHAEAQQAIPAGQTPAETAESVDRPATAPRLLSRRLREGIFGPLVVVVATAAIGLFFARLQGPVPLDVAALQVRASMAGFEPATLTVRAGQAVKIELTSMDSPLHVDGGGRHQFAIDALRIDWTVDAQTTKTFRFTAPGTPGTYTFYCDVCCGGKENPAMQGTLTVTA